MHSSSPPRPVAPRLRRAIGRCALALGSMLAVLAALEGVLRALDVRPPQRPSVASTGNVRPVAPPIGYEMVPGTIQTWIYPGSAFGPERIVEAHVNAHGFRGRWFPPARSRAWRVLCLGDSFTFGTGVEDHETWPARLQQFFAATLGPGAVEVWNCGVEGFDTLAEIELLATRLVDLQPDLVLVGYYANDASTDEVRPRPLTAFEVGLARWCGERPIEVARVVRSRSWLAEFVAQGVNRRLVWTRPAQVHSDFHEDGRRGYETVKREMVRARDLCWSRGICFAVVLFPTLQRVDGRLVTHRPYQRLAGFLDAQRIRWIDLEPAFDGRRVESMWVHPLDMHPNAEAHAIAAGAVGRALFADRGLPGPMPER